jgi:hypothetical protein
MRANAPDLDVGQLDIYLTELELRAGSSRPRNFGFLQPSSR